MDYCSVENTLIFEHIYQVDYKASLCLYFSQVYQKIILHFIQACFACLFQSYLETQFTRLYQLSLQRIPNQVYFSGGILKYLLGPLARTSKIWSKIVELYHISSKQCISTRYGNKARVMESEIPSSIMFCNSCFLHELYSVKLFGQYDYYEPGSLARDSVFMKKYYTIINA